MLTIEFSVKSLLTFHPIHTAASEECNDKLFHPFRCIASFPFRVSRFEFIIKCILDMYLLQGKYVTRF